MSRTLAKPEELINWRETCATTPALIIPQRNQSSAIRKMNINISFKPDGTAQCLWNEALPLHELGKLQITRASNLEFNNTTQQWEVKDGRGHMRFFSKSRSTCLEWEQQNLQPD